MGRTKTRQTKQQQGVSRYGSYRVWYGLYRPRVSAQMVEPKEKEERKGRRKPVRKKEEKKKKEEEGEESLPGWKRRRRGGRDCVRWWWCKRGNCTEEKRPRRRRRHGGRARRGCGAQELSMGRIARENGSGALLVSESGGGKGG